MCCWQGSPRHKPRCPRKQQPEGGVPRRIGDIGAEHIPISEPWEEQLSALLAKLKDNAALPEKLQAASDVDAAVAMTKDAGIDISKVWVQIGLVHEPRQDHNNNQNKDKTWKTKPTLSMPYSLQSTSCRTCF